MELVSLMFPGHCKEARDGEREEDGKENYPPGDEKRILPAQFTSAEGEGSDLYACHIKEAAFARLLLEHQTQ